MTPAHATRERRRACPNQPADRAAARGSVPIDRSGWPNGSWPHARSGKLELIVPRKARLLFAVTQFSPRLGDWLHKKMT